MPCKVQNDAALNFHNEVAAVFRDLDGIDEMAASSRAIQFIAALKKRVGRDLYIPAREIREVRNAAVLRAFNGHNHTEVMRAHDISRGTLYRIIGQARPRNEQ